MSENHERFKNVTAGIQSIALAVAVAVGGIWTIYTFSILGTREKARAEIDKDKADFEKAKVEQERQANSGLDIAINAKQEQLAGDKGYYISALVKITNKGLRNRFIDFSEPPLSVTKVEFDENGNSSLSFLFDQKNILSDSIVLRTGTTVDYPFLVKVPEKGFYMISFGVELNKEEMEIHRQSGGPDVKGISWGGDAYVLVK
jgi:hypothetical protein